jgi:probable HAF family extracellular repeat protein
MRFATCALVIVARWACGIESETTGLPEATARSDARVRANAAPEPRYRVEIIESTLGGQLSRGSGINNRGWIAGFSNLAGDETLHATLWRNGAITDLGTLGGPASRVPWPGIDNSGRIVGIAHTGEPDPLNEAWSCEAGFFLPETNPRQICGAFFWEDGVMQKLPTLGGNHAFAAGINNRGQVVGWAETAVRDPTCTGVQVLQFRAVMWDPKKGTVTQLPPLPGDSASSAVGINQRGQAVGISGDCDQAVGRFTARRSVLWDDGAPMQIPDLGGITWHTPQDINEAGDVVGFSNPPGEDPVGEFIAHGFLWEYGSETAIDLGTLSGDPTSQAQALNNRGQVVGVSFGGEAGVRAFLWLEGEMMDLNALAGPGFGPGEPYRLLSARDINDAGVITGDVEERSTGRRLAFVATPSGRAPR